LCKRLISHVSIAINGFSLPVSLGHFLFQIVFICLIFNDQAVFFNGLFNEILKQGKPSSLFNISIRFEFVDDFQKVVLQECWVFPYHRPHPAGQFHIFPINCRIQNHSWLSGSDWISPINVMVNTVPCPG
jgi:hypothetical protein